MENIASVKCIVIWLKWSSGRVIETSSTNYFGGLQNFCLQTMPRTFLLRFWSVDFQPHLFCQVKSAQERTFRPAKFKPLYVTNPRLGLITCWSMGQKLRLFESSIVFSSVLLLVTACNHFFSHLTDLIEKETRFVSAWLLYSMCSLFYILQWR